MVNGKAVCWLGCLSAVLAVAAMAAETSSDTQSGGIRGMVYDKDFDLPLAGVQISIVETGQRANGSEEGNYVLYQINPGTYTLVFTKEGYIRFVKADVVVSPGQMTELNASLSGEIMELEEFLVKDILFESGTESALLNLRMDNAAMMDSIGSDLMSRAGAGDAAAALKLVAGASVQDGKYAVIRGLPDRYVNSQMNGVRLPTADSDKRAVQLDQFPSAVIESIQVSKTFTPDQQGDASGGAVNVVLKGVPKESMVKFSTKASFNSQVSGRNDFLTYPGKGVNYWGNDDGDQKIQYEKLGSSWDGAVGTTRDDAPFNYDWSFAAGHKIDFEDHTALGAFVSLYNEHSSSFYKGGKDDSYWVESPGARMTPQYSQGTPDQGDFKTSLFDITQGSQSAQTGGLGVLGLETPDHNLTLSYMYTSMAEKTATLAEDTRGKAYYFPGYNPNDPTAPGNQQRDAAPYLRTETLEYTQRTTQTLQLSGRHQLFDPQLEFGNLITLLTPELDWGISRSSASMNQPDKRQFGSLWLPPSFNPGFPPWVPASTDPAVHLPYKPAANFTIGNLQRVWKDITEESQQYYVNTKFPFKQWSGDEGYLKLGVFEDRVNRSYNQDSYSNFNDNAAKYYGPWEDLWSRAFPFENHPITAADIDVDYEGQQKISAWYYMIDMPMNSWLNIIGGARYETTELNITNTPEKDVTWLPPGAGGPVKLNPGDADVAFEQKDMLPSLGFVLKPFDRTKLRGSYSETVARQTFKELTPIQQMEYLGGDVFVGNPELKMSALKNYDLRLDLTPNDDELISLSYFYKDVTLPIEYVQRNVGFTYTTATNYPKGKLSGYEIEMRKGLGRIWDKLEGYSLGANATFINSEVTLPDDEIDGFNQPNIAAPMRSRDMTGAPHYLYNLFLTYEPANTGLQATVFYTVQGDTLIAGAGESNGRFVPNVYQTEYGTLNLSVSQKLGKNCKLTFQAKNLLDPAIETVYRSKYIGDDVTKSSYQKGMEFTLSIGFTF
jgi:outer membrane receptor protein involved in Fe transport